MKKLLALTLFLSLCLIICPTTLAQKNICIVENRLKTPVTNIYAYILNGLDSTIVKEYFSTNGLLMLEKEGHMPSARLLYITGFGVEEKYIHFTEEQSLPDTLFIDIKSYTTDEVVVRASRGITSQHGGKTVVNVGSSELLKGMPSVVDILNFSPGIKVNDNESITIFGKGTPLIIIDGIEANGINELTILQPDQIKTIEIDRSPSSKYGATHKAVLIVTTSREKSDKLSMQLYNTARYSGNFNNFAGITLNSGVGKFTNYLSYDFRHVNRTIDNINYNVSFIKSYAQTILDDEIYNSRNNSQDLLAGTKYLINNKNRIDLQYNFLQNRAKSGSWSNISIETPDDKRLFKNRTNNTFRPAMHILNVKYTLDTDSVGSLNIFLDYITSITRSDKHLYECLLTENSTRNTSNLSNSRSNIITGRIEYEKMLLPMYDLTMLVGGKFSAINNFYDFSSYNFDKRSYNYNNHNFYKDETSSLYLTAQGSFGKFTLDAALRAEANHNSSLSNGTTLNDEWMFNIFPSFSAEMELSQKVNLFFSYNNKIRRPMLSEIDPTITYLNEFSYSQGNPLLKPTITHDLSVQVVLWQNLTLGTSYTINSNPSVLAAENYVHNQNVLRYSYINLPKSTTAGLSAGYDNSWGIFSLNTECYLYYTRADIPYMGSIEKRHKPSVDLYITNSFEIIKNLSLYYTFNYTSENMELMSLFTPSYLLAAGVSLYVLDKTLQITVSGNDLLKKRTGWDDRYGYINSGSHELLDSRYVGLTLRYKFRNFSSNFRRNNSSQEEMGRL